MYVCMYENIWINTCTYPGDVSSSPAAGIQWLVQAMHASITSTHSTTQLSLLLLSLLSILLSLLYV